MENKYNFEELENNLIDVIKESQIKIGYTENPVELYYPCQALNNLLESNLDDKQMTDVLKEFSEFTRSKLGQVSSHYNENVFCLKIPAEGVKYIHENVSDSPFLVEFINFVRSTHNATIEDVKAIFQKYSDFVVCEEFTSSDEFDYLLYFENEIPDNYRYCISFDLGHVIYHRFTPADYSQLGF